MRGMEMLLKSFGIDPDEIKKTAGQMGNLAIDFKTQLDRIERKVDLILSILPSNVQLESENNVPNEIN